jgi:hypothetical protein
MLVNTVITTIIYINMEQSSFSPDTQDSGAVVVTGHPTANWYPVHSNAASEAVEAQLDAQIKDLSRARTAANYDMAVAFPSRIEPSRLKRLGRSLRHIIGSY